MHYLYIYFVFLFVSNKRQNGWSDWAHIFLVNLHVPGKVQPGAVKVEQFCPEKNVDGYYFWQRHFS